MFQGAPDFNPMTHVPMLDAVIARAPDAILIAPTDTVQLVESLRKANDAGIPVITFVGSGVYQVGAGDADFPLAYIASDNVLGGRIAAALLPMPSARKARCSSPTSIRASPRPISARKASSSK
ncbi:MAG: substrate-binding domain-containing protein [Candidatus Devosia euplotis]|nr:substrate-binding domain-containing protein [Candidatus Devosia euplotis]